MTLTIGGACSGVGMLERAVQNTFGGETIWHSEIDVHASKVLAARSGAPNLGDLTAVDWSRVERPDVFCAGFPCTDLSIAGRRAGIRGSKSGLWWMIHEQILSVQRPPVVMLENVSAIVNGRDDEDGSGAERERGVVGPAAEPAGRTWLGAVLGSLADLGYVGRYGVVRAADAGAPHLRARWFCIATQPGATVRPVGFIEPAEHLTAHLLPTPTASQPGSNAAAFISRKIAAGIGDKDRGAHVTDLAMVVEHFLPTPQARDGDRRGKGQASRYLNPERSNNLDDAVDLLPAPVAVMDPDTFGRWLPAVRRWEAVTGMAAPAPKEPPNKLAAPFAEWMMGWPAGWCTGVDGVGRGDALKMCGNGVVPQQAELALRLLCR